MAATMKVYCDYGGSDGSPGTNQDTSALGPPNVRFKTSDDNTIDANNPIPIPAAGTTYSYWKHLYLLCSVAPSTQIDNVKFYTDGSGFGTGITVKVGDETPTKNSGSDAGYVVATGTQGSTGDELVANNAQITGSTDAFSYTSASPKSVSISESGNIMDAQNETTDYLVVQMEVDNTASPGNLTDETITFRYDEI